jgi:hypothetical protein
MGPPHLLQGAGWTRTTMKLGDIVTVQGSAAKNGTNRANARSVTTPMAREWAPLERRPEPVAQRHQDTKKAGIKSLDAGLSLCVGVSVFYSGNANTNTLLALLDEVLEPPVETGSHQRIPVLTATYCFPRTE